MKTKILIPLLAILIAMSSCSTPNGAASSRYSDDVYYSSNDAATEKAKRDKEREEEKIRQAKEEQRREERRQRGVEIEVVPLEDGSDRGREDDLAVLARHGPGFTGR